MIWKDMMSYAVYPNEVKAFIGGKEYLLEVRTDDKGEPYFVEKEHPVPFEVAYYLVCLSEPEVMGSGSVNSKMEYTNDEKKAFELLADGRNELRRYVFAGEGRDRRIVSHWWDTGLNRWRDENNRIL